jgi:hypothetical protein
MSAQRAGRAQLVKEWFLGAASVEPRTLSDALGLVEEAPELQSLRHGPIVASQDGWER